jgi:anti-sigma B factor antagonist
MSSSARRTRLVLEDIGDVTVVNFVGRINLGAQEAQSIGEKLFILVDQEGRRKILLNFGKVDYLSSGALPMFIQLTKKLKQAGGRLAFFGVAPKVLEMFGPEQNLPALFKSYEKEQQALQAMAEVCDLTCPIPGCPGAILGAGWIQSWWEQCPECATFFSTEDLPRGAGEGIVRHVLLKTYPEEEVHLFAETPFTIRIEGRLDLFASEAVARLWRASPAPRRVLIDASRLTELSEPGLSALLEFASQPDTKAAILLGEQGPPKGASFPADLTFTDRGAAVAALGELPQESRRPLIVKVRQEETGG